jgi:hypothetical protein
MTGINNDQLARWVILSQKVPDSLAHEATPVASRHDAAQNGLSSHRMRAFGLV